MEQSHYARKILDRNRVKSIIHHSLLCKFVFKLIITNYINCITEAIFIPISFFLLLFLFVTYYILFVLYIRGSVNYF